MAVKVTGVGAVWIGVGQYIALVTRNKESYPISKLAEYTWTLVTQIYNMACHIPKIY